MREMAGPQRLAARNDTLLLAAVTLFTLAVLVHNFDDLRRGGGSVPVDVFWIGTLAVVNEVGVVVLAFMRHPKAAAVAFLSGIVLAAGYVFVHFTPERSWLSDSFLSVEVSTVSVVAAIFETVAEALLATAALVVLARGVPGREPAPVSAGRALRHPVVLAMTVGNVVVAGLLLTR